jgi:UDP-glucose 4-epimerase
MNIIVTGGCGFFGSILVKYLVERNHNVLALDIIQCQDNFLSKTVDIRDLESLQSVFSDFRPDIVIHAAAMLAHEKLSKNDIWETNVVGTENILKVSIDYKVKKLIFLSTNCLWAQSFDKPVDENEAARPIETYGKSKLAAEKILNEASSLIDICIFRSPTIMSAGRLGLLGILFQFIDENRKIYIVGDGKNRYQFIYAPDYCRAIELSILNSLTGTFNIGSDNVTSMRDMFNYVITNSESKSKIFHLPKNLSIFILKLLYKLNLSPLGEYQYRMLSGQFEFDTSKFKSLTNWKPTKTNNEMLLESYLYFKKNKDNLFSKDVSPHQRVANAGILNLLRKIS